MNRAKKILNIGELLARFVAEVKVLNAGNLYDINIHSENVVIPLLNEVLGLHLQNINSIERKNYPAIDLADFKGRVAVQVTSSAEIEKINSTLDKFGSSELYKNFDVLLFYILTDRQKSYSSSSLSKHTPNELDFDPDKHILDFTSLLARIKDLSLGKIDTIERILKDEFADIKIEQRRRRFGQKYLRTEPEPVYTNLLSIAFPSQMFTGKLQIDKEAATDRLNDWLESKGEKRRKKFKIDTLIKEELRHYKIYKRDFLIHEGWILTFKNLNDPSEWLRKIIEEATIESRECFDFYSRNLSQLNVFKDLLRRTMNQMAHTKEMEWSHDAKALRFKKDNEHPRTVQKRWKGIKESTKTVVFEVLNKKLGHIICFRHLAFKCQFDWIDGDWFAIINPTWSFTNPYTSRTSRYEPYYMSGLKRMENNQAVYYFFRFFAYYLAYQDLFTPTYEYIQVKAVSPLLLTPSLNDKQWRPIKHEDFTNLIAEGLQQDLELQMGEFEHENQVH